uniref:Alpha/beta hydrolase n=2 Tax=unclassified Streptomyces TaxID=2593676 RepID=A0AAU1ZUP5_9ACTN
MRSSCRSSTDWRRSTPIPPAPVEDCYAGLVWMAKNADELGIDPERLLIAGVSGGGGLAAGTALLARDRAFPSLRSWAFTAMPGRRTPWNPTEQSRFSAT